MVFFCVFSFLFFSFFFFFLFVLRQHRCLVGMSSIVPECYGVCFFLSFFGGWEGMGG